MKSLTIHLSRWRYWGPHRFDIAYLALVFIPIICTAIAYMIPPTLLATCGALPNLDFVEQTITPNSDALKLRYYWAAAFTIEIIAAAFCLIYATWVTFRSIKRSAVLPTILICVSAGLVSLSLSTSGERAYVCLGTSANSNENIFDKTLGKIGISDTESVMDTVSNQILFINFFATAAAVSIAVAAAVVAWRVARLSFLERKRNSKQFRNIVTIYLRRYQTLFALASGLVTLTVLSIVSWTQLPLPYMTVESSRLHYVAAANHYTLYSAFTFSVVLAGIFVPTGIVLFRHIPDYVRIRIPLMISPKGLSHGSTKTFRQAIQEGAEGAASKTLDLTALLAPIIAAVVSLLNS